MSTETGYWFADIDEENGIGKYRWQPCLQLPGGVCHSFDVWLPSEDDCLDYIRRHIIGATLKETL